MRGATSPPFWRQPDGHASPTHSDGEEVGRVLRSQHADTHDIEKIFQYTNRPPIGGSERRVCFPFSCPPIDERLQAVILNWAALEA
jgi:hypothetical protein